MRRRPRARLRARKVMQQAQILPSHGWIGREVVDDLLDQLAEAALHVPLESKGQVW